MDHGEQELVLSPWNGGIQQTRSLEVSDGRRGNGGRRNPVGGRRMWQPTAEQRSLVFEAARRGLPQDVMAGLLGVSESTLKRRCVEELHLGAMAANAQVAWTAYQMAVSGKHPRMTWWWLATRCGWK